MDESSSAARRELLVKWWAAVVLGDDPESVRSFGASANDDLIPPGLRRRMGRLERFAVRCTLGVLGNPAETDELVFCSRYGNVETLRRLLSSIAAREPMSPMAFSGSVHNATPGFVGQICATRLRHTAISAGRRTLAAGFVEAYALLRTGERKDVTITFAELPLPDPYCAFDDERSPGIALAARLGIADDRGEGAGIGEGRSGALDLVERLRAGVSRVVVDEFGAGAVSDAHA